MFCDRRIDIAPALETTRVIDRAGKKGGRSLPVSEAVCRDVASVAKARLRRLLKDGASRHAEHDFQIAEDWTLRDRDA
ncbi:MAG: hypothetical protein ACRD6R_04635 [Candidatus Polarisedimenticolia bacterium]